MNKYTFTVIIESDSDGYVATCQELQGCYSQGNTYEEVMENLRDAIRLHIEDRRLANEEIPQSKSVSMTSLEIAA